MPHYKRFWITYVTKTQRKQKHLVEHKWNVKGNFEITALYIACESSRYFCGSTTDFPLKLRLRNDCKNSILMTWHCPDLGRDSDWLKICFTNQRHYPFLGSNTSDTSMAFLQSFLRRHFVRKRMVASQNVGYFLRLIYTNPTLFPTCKVWHEWEKGFQVRQQLKVANLRGKTYNKFQMDENMSTVPSEKGKNHVPSPAHIRSKAASGKEKELLGIFFPRPHSCVFLCVPVAIKL